ncbi:MAG: zeta toxin family protein, partial [Roseimicrobium sp.]
MHGRESTEAEIYAYMRHHGFKRAYQGAYLGNDDLLITDALPRNFLTDKAGHVHAIDLLISYPTQNQLERIENQINADPANREPPPPVAAALATNRPAFPSEQPVDYPSKNLGPYKPDYTLPLTGSNNSAQAFRQKGERVLNRFAKDWNPLFNVIFNRDLPLERRKRALARFFNRPFTHDLEFPSETTLAEMLGQEEGQEPRTLATAARPVALSSIRPVPEDLARAQSDRAANNARWQRASASNEPLILLELDGPQEAFQIIDGHHRFLKAQIDQRPTIQAFVWPKSPAATGPATLGRGLSALLGSPMPPRQAMHAFTRLSTLADKAPLKTGQQEQLARAAESLGKLFQFETASFVSPAPAPALTRDQRQTRQTAIDAGLTATEADQAARMPDFAARAAEITAQSERLDQENLRREMQSAGFDAASIDRATVGSRNWSPLLTQRLRNLLTDKQTLASNRPAPEREDLDLGEAIDRLETYYADPADTDTWPEDLAKKWEEDPLRVAVEDEADLVQAMPHLPDALQNSPVMQAYVAAYSRYYELSEQVSKEIERFRSLPSSDFWALTPPGSQQRFNELAEPGQSFSDAQYLLKTRTIERMAHEAALSEVEREDLEAAEEATNEAGEWLEGPEMQALLAERKAALQTAAAARAKNTIQQIEATGRYTWNRTTQSFDYIEDSDLRVLFSNRPAPGIAEAFPNWSYGYDAYGLPNPPRTLADGDPLLEPTLNKKIARLRSDHPLVTAGLLTAGVDIPRKALHAAIVAHFIRQGTPLPADTRPVLYATGGGGGAGKSSILKRLRKLGLINTEGAVLINADDIKELIPEFNEIKAAGDGRAAALVHEESGRISNNLLTRVLDPKGPRYNLIFDATLANGEKTAKQFSTWKAAGYRIHLIGVTLAPADALYRAVVRARDSGRWVPTEDLVKAHAGFNTSLKEYLPLVDDADVYDNTPPDPHQVAQKTGLNGPISIVNPEIRSKIDARSSPYERASQTSVTEGDSVEPGGRVSGRESPGSTALRQPEPESQRSGDSSPSPLSLATARRGETGEQLNLFDLLTPAQQDAKLSQPDLFAGTAYEKPRPTPQRPAQPARRPSPASPRGEASGFGELFGTSGMGTAAAGPGRPGQQPAPGLPGFGGAGGADAVGGTEAGSPGLDPRAEGNTDRRPGADVSGMPRDAGDFDAYTYLRPDVGSPARNFEVPAGVESLAPATDRAKILANIEAIRLLKQLETDQRNATPEEKSTLAAYTGWGAFKEAFNSKYEEDIASYWDARPDKRYMPDWLQSWERNHRPLHKLLRENMTEDEFASASASTLNAHYTAAPIIRAMWKMVERLGFTGGRALEPSAGAGHYLGLAPSNIADKTAWQTVELDDLSARLLAKLYPEATVNEERGGDSSGAFTKPDGTYYSPASRRVTGLGFERARIPNGSLDLVISNVPFHESGPKKKGFPNLNLHNFFFAHALDKVKPGGLVAFITSESTMQNNMKQRDFIASKGDLVAAFRLPNNAFKGNAGTEVTTDIIILRKPDGTPFKGQPWRNLTEVGRQTITMTQGKDQTVDEFIREAERTGTILNTEGKEKKPKPYWKGDKRALDVSAPIMVNEYFVANPANVLGEHTLASTMYRAGGYAVVAPDGLDVPARLDALVNSLPANVMGKQDTGDVKDIVLASRDDKPFSFKEQDGKLYEVQPDGSMEEAEWSTNPDFVKTWRSWKRVSNAVEELVAAESSDTFTDEGLDRMRRDLNTIYDTHIAQHNAISKRFGNKHRHLRSDPSYALTSALENEVITVDTKTGKKTYSYRKADIFKQRIGRPIVVPTKAQNVDDALEKSLAWKGRVDADYGAALLGLTPEQFEAQALQRPDIFRNPTTGLLEQGEEYLSGNVRQKLEAAQAALEDNPAFGKNVDALITAQPERKEISRISPVLGARWIPAPVYQAFIKDVLQGSDTVEYVPAGNSWMISGTGLYKTEEHGTERKGPASLFKHALDMTEPLVYDGSGDTRALNPTETAAARAALDKLRRAFIDYVKTSDTQVTIDDQPVAVWEATENAFNETSNSYVTPRHTGAYLTFPGLNTDYVYTKAHRRSVIARFLTTRRGMMAHGVGSGKTFNQIILAQEMRRLGLAKKPMIVVQNATLGQFAKSYLKAYPSAKILVPTKSDFEAKNRQRL